MEIIISLELTIFGVFLGWILGEPYRLPRWIALNKRSNWKGIWFFHGILNYLMRNLGHR